MIDTLRFPVRVRRKGLAYAPIASVIDSPGGRGGVNNGHLPTYNMKLYVNSVFGIATRA